MKSPAIRSILIPVLTLALPALLAIGCAKKDEAGEGGEASGGKAAAEPLTIDKLNLKIDAPKGASQREMLGNQMIQAPGLVITVGPAKDGGPATVEAEAKEAEMFSPKNITSEKLADGYVFQFENKGSMGANYFVRVRREIAGKAYMCTATGGEKKMTANAVAACKSLRQ